ncbi:hypothetical protein ACOSQ3_015826 [Xanthoceras sorbifolium]
MMWNTMENEERERVVAVAVDKDKCSQYALKWAIEHVLGRHQTVKLIHVIQRPPSNTNPVRNDDQEAIEQQQPADNNQTMDVFLPFRCYCTRRHIQCELVVLERQDVARALIEYVSQYGVESLLVGAPSKNGLTRLFKAADIPATVMKWAPDFCNVYVVSKGKCNAIRSATRPVPPLPLLPCTPRTPRNPPAFLRSYDEYPTSETDLSCMNSERTSTDSTFFAFYENLGFNLNPYIHDSSSRPSLNLIDHHHHHHDQLVLPSGRSTPPPVDLTSLPELNSSLESSGRTSSASQNNEDVEEEMKRVKRELKQTMEMYHAACKEALAAKEKARELEQWKMKEERRSKEAEMREEREKAKCKAATEAAEAAQKIIKLEVQKRVTAEMKALKEGEEKTKVLDALGHSQIVLKYQSLFHILVVLFLFYCYFSVFIRNI